MKWEYEKCEITSGEKIFRTPHKYIEYPVVVFYCEYIFPTWKNNIDSISKEIILLYFSAVDRRSVTCWERGTEGWPARGRRGLWVSRCLCPTANMSQLLEAAPLHHWPHLTRAADCLQHCWPSKNRTEEMGSKFRGENVFLVVEV